MSLYFFFYLVVVCCIDAHVHHQESHQGLRNDANYSSNSNRPPLPPIVPPRSEKPSISPDLAREQNDLSPTLGSTSSSTSSNFLSSIKRKMNSSTTSVLNPSPSSSSTQSQLRGGHPSGEITSTAAIRQNVNAALSKCRSDTSASIVSNDVKQQLTEPASSYCDSTAVTNLIFVGDVSGLRVFVARNVINPLVACFSP